MDTITFIQVSLGRLQQLNAACTEIRDQLPRLAAAAPLGEDGRQRIEFWFEILGRDAFAGEPMRASWLEQAEQLRLDADTRGRLSHCLQKPREGVKPRDCLSELALHDILATCKIAAAENSKEIDGSPCGAEQIQSMLRRFTEQCERSNQICNELIDRAARRLEALCGKMLRRSSPGVRRVADTGDILAPAVMRLRRALCEVSPLDPRAFFGLAGLQIRRELIDIGRRVNKQLLQLDGEVVEVRPSPSDNSAVLECWTRFHDAVGRLPAERREVVELHWYQGLTLAEVADFVGRDFDTVKKRIWRPAREQIERELGVCAAILSNA
jgi:RNA polymerase sigma factor (sigma-70 family)